MRRFAGIGLAVLTLSGCSLSGPNGFQSVGMAQQPPSNSTWAPRGTIPADPNAANAQMTQQGQMTMGTPANPYGLPARGAAMPTGSQPPANGVVQTNYTPGQPATNPNNLNLSDPATMELMNQTTTTSKSTEVVRAAQATDPALAAPPAYAPPAPNSAPMTEDRVVGVTPALRVVNSPRFTLGYELRDLGTNGLSSLELWMTTDTRTWSRLPSAQFQPSSCTVTVPAEGTYGFTVVAHDGQHPHPGESPQVWVTVDTMKPTVKILDVAMSLITKPRTLEIHWDARDRNFGPRPITISYAEKAEGPWMALIANVPNSGHYEAPVPAGLPANLFFRVEAIDMAGNVGMATTTEVVKFGPEKEVVIQAPVAPPAPPAPPPGSPVSFSHNEVPGGGD